VEDRAVSSNHGGKGSMRLSAHVREVSDDGPWVWPRWKTVVVAAVATVREDTEDEEEDSG
jgi:hypothetical protein